MLNRFLSDYELKNLFKQGIHEFYDWETFGEYEIIKQDSNYLYVKEYTLYNRDSSIVRYKADKIYNGVIVNKNRRSSYHGIPGKGGHHSTSYYVTVQFNGTTQTFRSSNLYRKYNKGDRVRVREVWYPRHDIIVL